MSAQQDDYLGYTVYAQTLWARIARSLEKDAYGAKELGDDPLVVGIFGEWGAGKSKLLSLIQKHAVKDAEIKTGWRKLDTGNCTLTVPVFFQPWKYEHEEHLHVPILLHILAALEQELKNSQTWTEAFLQSLPSGVKEHLGKVVGAFGVLLSGVALAMDRQVSLFSRLGLAIAGLGATAVQKGQPEDKGKAADTVEFKANGRFFYEMHQTLQAITRPSRYAKQLTGVDLSTSVSINFVLFIDDLDRCLPEKAVEALELIKTVFNLESFAFVLALDEEVVERGIGHRYRDYNFKDKKPEMPITGFEYLEKIVHLPFRLPALTIAQAADFVRRYESQLCAEAAQRWFDAPKVRGRNAKDGDEHALMRGVRGESIDLLPLALSSFAHYVPRKLIRMVELMHSLAEVGRQPGYRSMGREYGGQIDPRVVLALVLLQLFQPELYRLMRRQHEAFAVLLSAFVRQPLSSSEEKSALSLTHVSDADLCQWILGEGKDLGDLPAENSKLIDFLSSRISSQLKTASEQERHLAQSVKLPLVAQILAHRAVQRHTFDPIKLFQTLASDMTHTEHHPEQIVLRPYLTLLSKQMQRNLEQPFAPKPNRHRIHWIEPLWNDLISDNSAVQANILSRHEIPEDAYLTEQTAQALTQKAQEVADEAKKHQTKSLKTRQSLLKGLYHLAPAIASREAEDLWHCFEDMVTMPTQPGQLLEAPKRAALYADVQDRLGLNEIFDQERPYICAKRYENNSDKQEPLPGYIKIKGGKAWLGSKEDESDNKPKEYEVGSDFFIARYLTTVRQYAGFVTSGGYKESKYWDSQGWEWRRMNWASETSAPELRQWLDGRSAQQREQPMLWAEQLEHPQRPVYGINWFESRAYCRWLSDQLSSEEWIEKEEQSAWKALQKQGYTALLPTEQQWERAARAQPDGSAGSEIYPWPKQEDEENISRLANISASDIDEPSVVGIFAPNPIGLQDMSGNVWEWQDGVYEKQGKYEPWQRIPLIRDPLSTGKAGGDWLLTHEEWQKSELPALRGGSWNYSAVNARASFRGWNRPVNWVSDVGFRVVLSLA